MADKRISQLIERTDIANNDVLPIVASGATTTNKVTVSTLQDWMQDNLDVGVTSVGLSVPSAFTISGSPVTTSGNITISGAGTTAQYIRGDGSLADFPSSLGGGGASVSYYLNGSVSQGTIGGVAYRELSKSPILGSGTDFTINADGYIASFITDAGDPSLLEIPGGNWNFETYFQASSGGGTPSFYVELYKVSSGGTATLIATSSGSPELIAFGTNTTPYFSSLAVPTTTLALTDRLAIRYYVTHSGRTITLHTENNTLCQIITTFTTGLTALNGLTAQVQNFATGTSGTDFNISSASTTHTFNLPDASASNRGAVTTGSQVFGGVKTFANGLSLSAVGGSNQVTRIVNIGTLHEGSATLNQIGFNSANNIYFGKGLSNGGVLQWTNAAVRYYTLPDADGTLALASQIPTNPVGGTGAQGRVAYWSGSGTITSDSLFQWNDTFKRLGIGRTPTVSLDVEGSATVSNTIKVESSAGNGLRIYGSSGTNQWDMYLNGTNLRFSDNTGTGSIVFDRPLTGTSATFAGRLSATGSDFHTLAGISASAQLKLERTTTSAGVMYIGADVDGFKVFNSSFATNLLIAPTGAATFSSSVTATELYLSTSSGLVGNINSSATNGGYLTWQTAGTTIADIGTANQIFGSGGAEVFGINARGARSLSFGTNNTARLTIASTGAATFSSSVTTGGNVLTPAGSGLAFTGDASRIITPEDNVSGALIQTPGIIRFNAGGTSTRMTITASGNVGIGTASPNAALTVKSIEASAKGISIFGRSDSIGTLRFFNSTGATEQGGLLSTSTYLGFSYSDTERMRITSGGFLKASNNGVYDSASGNYHELNTNASGSSTLVATHRAGSPFGIESHFSGADPNNATNYMFAGYTTAGGFTWIYRIFSNGTVSARSDARWKKNIETTRNGYIDDLCKLRVVKYNWYNHEDDAPKELGLIAQEVEQVFPNLIQIDPVIAKREVEQEDGTIIEEEFEDGVSRSIKTSVLPFMLLKAMQEQQEQIKELQAQIDSLKTK
jgi:hypothetical protein